MISIMEHVHQYVPAKTENVEIDIPCSDEKLSIEVTEYHRPLFGGDQLTAKGYLHNIDLFSLHVCHTNYDGLGL